MSETPEETDRRLAFMDEIRAAARNYQDEQVARNRQMIDELRAANRLCYDRAVAWHSNVTDYMAHRFPRLTWRDIWLALWIE